MKEGWEYKKLGDVCQSDLGKTLNQSKDTGDLYPYLCAVNILWDKIDLSTLKQTRFEKTELERYSVKKGDLLVCEGGDIGRAAIWDRDEVIQYQNALHRIRFNGKIISRFCLLYLRNLKQKGILDHKYGKGVTILHLVKSSLLSIPIPIPSISEQQQIVSELDLLSGVIEKQKAQLEELDKLAQSVFYDMFGDPVTNEKGWEIKKLKDIASKIGSGATPRGGNQSYKDEGVSLIRSMNVHNNFFIYDDLALIDDEQAALLNNVIVESNDVLLNITGASVARCCMVPDDVLPARVNQHVCIIRPIKDLANSIYLNRFFTSIEEQSVLLLLSRSNAATREALPKNLLDNCNIVLPPLTLQQEFAAKVKAIEAMKAKVRQSLKEAETLFNERMNYYFN